MTNYNLTFKEAVIAGIDGETIASEYLPSLATMFEEGCWIRRNYLDPKDVWEKLDFLEKDITCKWRIITKEELDSAEEKDSCHIMHERRISDLEEKLSEAMDYINQQNNCLSDFARRIAPLEEKLEATENIVSELLDKRLIAEADIKTLYAICDNNEEVISFSENRIDQLQAMLKINDKDSYGGTE